ncbi:MAG: DUF3370 domain-containing protein [Candidatus Obscuribacterales bacterium]|nr:DUF3370 domain-containing protein [Candidatus Obscuribacterales bacterium]
MKYFPPMLLALYLMGTHTHYLAYADEVKPQTVIEVQEIRPLPGKLDKIPVFNSNSPEVITNEGILLSTFPKDGKSFPDAHLNYPLSGRFDIFTHHIANASNASEIKTLYECLLIHNPTKRKITVTILQTASYLSQPDAPFIQLPDYLDNPDGKVFAGPGDRITSELLREADSKLPKQIILNPDETVILSSQPIPVKDLKPPLNGRSTLFKIKTTGPTCIANLATFANTDDNHQDIAPTFADWLRILNSGDLAKPREKQASKTLARPIVYGRVAGIAEGDTWLSTPLKISLPEPGQSISYAVSTIDGGTWGTEQIQSAPILVRYPDTAFQAHGNYAVKYDLTFPLFNPGTKSQSVTLTFQTPLKTDKKEGQLSFLDPPPNKIFFRGTLCLSYKDDNGQEQSKYMHVVSRRGQKGLPLVTLNIKPKSTRTVKVEFLYPPDSTPPQVLTIKTVSAETANTK